MMTKNKLLLSLVCVSSVVLMVAHQDKPQDAKSTTEAKTDTTPKKPNTGGMSKDVNTNIAINDIVSSGQATLDLTVRVVDSMEVLQTSKKGIDLSMQLDKKRQELSEEAKKQDQKLVQAKAEFKSKESTMSASARAAEESKLMKMTRDFENTIKSYEEDLKLAMQQATQEALIDLEKSVAEVAKKQGVDLVQDVSGRILFASPKAMITGDLVNAMDKHYAASKKSAQAKVVA